MADSPRSPRHDGAIESHGSLSFYSSSIKGVPGYFRVGQTVDGQWWFLDPDHVPFFSKGICGINRAGTQGGRKAVPGMYAPSVDRKYSYQTSPDSFVDGVFTRMREWGFNTAGSWVTAEFFDKGMPYTEILEFFHVGPHYPAPGRKRGLPDIFASAWVEGINAVAREICTHRRFSRDLVGYFTDNEIGFGKADDQDLDPGFEAGTVGLSLLREVLGQPAGTPGRLAAWEFLYQRHGTLDAVADAWGVPLPEEDSILPLNQSAQIIPGEAYRADAQAFVSLYAERYFRLASAAIRRHDPNHLILGCRFGAPPDNWVLDAIRPHVEVISANNYRPALFERYDPVYRYTGLPILIGEFSWNTGLYKEIPHPSEVSSSLTVRERMFAWGADTLQRAATHPGIVGYTWYRWVQPRSTEDKFTDGLVDYDDEPDIHHPLLSRINPSLDHLRLSYARPGQPGPEFSGLIRLWWQNPRPQVSMAESITLRMLDGKVAGRVEGWQFSGRVVDSSYENDRLELTIEASVGGFHKKEPLAPVEGVYRLRLTKTGFQLEGDWTGTVADEPSSGSVSGWMLHEFSLPS